MQNLMAMQPAMGAYALSASALTSSTSTASARGHANMSKQWLFDTCASCHMTANRDDFVTYGPADKHEGICDAQGGLGKSLGKGTATIQTGNAGILKLDDVRHIPTLKTNNLISGALLEEQGFQVEKSTTYPSDYTIYTPEGDTIPITIILGVNIYKVDIGEGN
jgi:hypothetical protein